MTDRLPGSTRNDRAYQVPFQVGMNVKFVYQSGLVLTANGLLVSPGAWARNS